MTENNLNRGRNAVFVSNTDIDDFFWRASCHYHHCFKKIKHQQNSEHTKFSYNLTLGLCFMFYKTPKKEVTFVTSFFTTF